MPASAQCTPCYYRVEDLDAEDLEEYQREWREGSARALAGQGQLDWANRLISAVRERGGIRSSGYGEAEYIALPVAIKNCHAHHTLDTLLGDMQESYPEFDFADQNELYDALARS